MPERYDGMGYWEIISRQMSIVTKNEQLRFKNSKIAVIGCGGIGGAAVEMLARMGVGEINIVDKDSFDMSNLNRQLMSSIDVIEKPKSEVTKEKLRLINPYVKINTFNEELTESNISKIIEDCDIIIDALDNLFTRVLISRFAREKNIPFIHGAVHGVMGQLTVFTDNTKSYEEIFSLPSIGKALNQDTKMKIQELSKGTPPVIGPIPNIIGCLESFEAFKIMTGKGEVILAPKILNFNLMECESFKIIEL